MLFLFKSLRYLIFYLMKSANRLANFVTIIVLVGQGILPGMILCHGEEGHVAVETTFEGCCSAFAQASPYAFRSLRLYELEPATHGSCGPCSDTLISTSLFAKPTHQQLSSLDPARNTSTTPGDIGVEANKPFLGMFDPAHLVLIPVRTTVLLL